MGNYGGSHEAWVRSRVEAEHRDSERKAAWAREVVNKIAALAVANGTGRIADMVRQWDKEQSKNPPKQYSLGRTGYQKGAGSAVPEPAELPEAYASLAAFHDYFADAARISPIPFRFGPISTLDEAAGEGKLHLAVMVSGSAYGGGFSSPVFSEVDMEHFLAMVKEDLEAHRLPAEDGKHVLREGEGQPQGSVFPWKRISLLVAILILLESFAGLAAWLWGEGHNLLQRIGGCWWLLASVFTGVSLGSPIILGKEGWAKVKKGWTGWWGESQ